MPRKADQRDFYDVLGVPRNAEHRTIRRAFHAHARRVHPDVAGGLGDGERFRELSQAYEVLSDERARLLYDRLAYRGPGGGGFGPVHPGVGRPTKADEHISDYELLRWIFGDDAPAEPPLTTRDDPVVIGVAFVALVTALVVLAALVLT
jgi:DnaJ-class molecular chaperone